MTLRYIDRDALAAQLDAEVTAHEKLAFDSSPNGIGTRAVNRLDGIADGMRRAASMVREAPAVADPVRGLVERLAAEIESLEFAGRRHAAENIYCQWCGYDDGVDSWSDQREHTATCAWKALVTEARAYLEGTKGGTDNAAG